MTNYSVGDKIITPAKKVGVVSSVRSKITITWENGLSGEYTPKQLRAWNYKKSSEDTSTGSVTKEATECNSDTPASLQESPVLNSELKPPELVKSSKQNSLLKTTPTLKQSSNTDIQKSPSTATSGTITLNRDNLTFTQLDFLVLEQAVQETVPDSNTQNHHSGLNHCDVLQMAAPISSSLKILKGLSIEDYEQFLADCEWLATVGTIRNSYRRRKSDRPNNVTDSLLLPTPTTYCKGSTGCRPAGQTRLEQKLKPYLTKGDKLHPAVPGWMMGFPVGWAERVLMDGGVTISVQLPFTPEYVTTQINAESATTSTLGQSAHCKLRSQSNESVTSPTSPQQFENSPVPNPYFLLTRTSAKPGTYIIDQYESLGTIKDDLGFGFVVDWLGFGKVPVPPSGKRVTYNWERDDDAIAKLAIAPQSLITKFLEEKPSTQELLILCPSCGLQQIYLSGGCGICGLEPAIECTQQLKVGDRTETFAQDNGVSELTPVNSSEDKHKSEEQLPSALSANIECTQRKVGSAASADLNFSRQQLQKGDRVRITKTRTQNLEGWIGYEATVTSINRGTISVLAGEGKQKKHLTLKHGWYEIISENFLEESKEASCSAQKPKRRQRKGCLYKYLENKKLKNGSIVSYPRIIEDKRDPDNPQHWRWGFNWEEKIDGEWKGRSIGSIPVGAIAMIQSMQNQGVPLEEIISFIKRAKAKK